MAFLRATSSRPTGLDEQPEVPHRGEAGLQGAAGVGHGAQGAHGRVVLHRVERAAVVGSAEEEVDLHVHQAREEREVTEVDDQRVIGDRRRRDLGDAVAGDEEAAGGDQLARDDVEHAGTLQVGVGRKSGTSHGALLGSVVKRNCHKSVRRCARERTPIS
jgi:hypothetical protein